MPLFDSGQLISSTHLLCFIGGRKDRGANRVFTLLVYLLLSVHYKEHMSKTQAVTKLSGIGATVQISIGE